MAFAYTRATKVTVTNTNRTSHVITLPELETGDLILMQVGHTGYITVLTNPSGYTSLKSETFAQIEGVALRTVYRRVDGTEGYVGDGTDTVTFITAINGKLAVTAQSWVAAEIPEVSAGRATGHSNYPNAPYFAPSETLDWVWMAVCSLSQTGGVVGYPGEYTDNRINATTGTGFGPQIASCTLEMNAAFDDPTQFVFAEHDWIAYTIAIAEGGPPVGVASAGWGRIPIGGA